MTWTVAQDPTYLSLLQKRLQTTHEKLLQMDGSQCPPYLALPELQAYKSVFSPQGFCCRFKSCPFFENGFSSIALRTSHETEHFPTYSCKECDFSVRGFKSKGALKRHTTRYHPRPQHEELPHELFPPPRPTVVRGSMPSTDVAMEGSGAVQNGQPSVASPLSFMRPEQVKVLPHLDQDTKTRYEVGIRKLWDIINTRPANSPEQQQAYSRLVQISATLMNGMRQWYAKKQQAVQHNSTSTTSHGSSNAPTFEQLNPAIQARVNATATQFIYPPAMTEGQRNTENWLREAKARFGQALQRTEEAEQGKADLQRILAARQQAGAATSEDINMFNTGIQKCQKAIAESDNFMIKFREQQQSFRQQAQQLFTAQRQPGLEDNHDQPMLANFPGN
jgi:hypothetical protein